MHIDQLSTLLCRAVACAAFLCHALSLAGTPPPVAHFFDNAAFGGAALSPSGRYLAAVTNVSGARDRLSVVNLDDMSVTVVAQFNDADVGQFRWISEERLLFDTADRQTGQRDTRFGRGLFAVNRNGKLLRQLARRRGDGGLKDGNDGRTMLPWHTSMLDQAGAQDSAIVYVQDINYAEEGYVQSRELLRLDTLSGRAVPVKHPGESQDWGLDHQGKPRLLTTSNKNMGALHYLDPASGDWRRLFEYDLVQGAEAAFDPLGFAPDGTLYVVSQMGKDTSALYRYDLAANKVSGGPVVELKGFDFDGALVTNQHKLLGVRVNGDAVGTVWFDPAMKALQQAVDKLLPTTINLVDAPVRAETPWVLVTSYSDHQPHNYFVFNQASGRLSQVGGEAPLIRPADMGAYDQVQYTARDGLPIPAWLSTPKDGGKNLPLVVLVHGGPFMRGSDWRWHAQAQFLASRGYAVLQPEFRGSSGYGEAHFRAGWKQWGLKMQDDLADGVKWAVAQGIADPRRVCIAGGSYGGYAALMGVVNDPDLYRCAIDWAGVTDLQLMYNSGWGSRHDLSERAKNYGMPQLVGDPVKDAAQLAATSPLQQAARIRRPLLLAYGGADARVPLVHGLKFHQAVKANNKDVEWIEYPEEGHGWYLPKNRIDFWTRVEKFLDRHIGAGAAAN
jgi:acetyl esterase/lipase